MHVHHYSRDGIVFRKKIEFKLTMFNGIPDTPCNRVLYVMSFRQRASRASMLSAYSTSCTDQIERIYQLILSAQILGGVTEIKYPISRSLWVDGIIGRANRVAPCKSDDNNMKTVATATSSWNFVGAVISRPACVIQYGIRWLGLAKATEQQDSSTSRFAFSLTRTVNYCRIKKGCGNK